MTTGFQAQAALLGWKYNNKKEPMKPTSLIRNAPLKNLTTLIRKATLKTTLATLLCTSLCNTAQAQLAAPNADGVSAGHTHLIVPDVEKHREIWKSFGAVEKSSGRLQLLGFPGMYILLREGTPALPSAQTTVNHIGFQVNNYAAIKAKLDAIGVTYVVDNTESGQILAELPDGVRVEFALDTTQAEPIVFHHTHLMAPDGVALQKWYVDVFGAEIGERRGLPSAVIPGGRVDILQPDGSQLAGTTGAAIDHIGFEVADMAAFKAKMDRMGIAFAREPERRDDINLTIAFITDPVGTYIEITEGLDEAE
jgi:catechol 2,3-dioxygenase-like lactoylglutathione lyase family enzyme